MKKILLITHEDKLVNFIIKYGLTDHFQVAHRNDIFHGLKFLSRRNVDILLYDIDAQGIDAVQAILVARKLNKTLHIIVIAAENKLLQDPNLNIRHINFLLFKPINFTNLREHLGLLLHDKATV